MRRALFFSSDVSLFPAFVLTAALTGMSGISEADAAPEVPSKQADSQEGETEDPQRPSQARAEYVTVKSSTTADGTTGHAPGGGLMPNQRAPRAQSGLTRDFIARQSPTESPVALIPALPGVVYSANDQPGTHYDQQGLSFRGLDQTELG